MVLRCCSEFLRHRTNLEKTLLSLSSILVLTLILVIIFSTSFQGTKPEKYEEFQRQCWSKECIQTAGDMVSFMNTSADSCVNFYGFSCGHYGFSPGQVTSVTSRATDALYDALNRLMNSTEAPKVDGFLSVATLYRKCIMFGSYYHYPKQVREDIIKLFKDMGVGIWPIIDPLYDHSDFNRDSTLTNLAFLDVSTVFKMEVVPDSSISGSYLLKIAPGGPRETGRGPEDIRGDAYLKSSMLTSFFKLGVSTGSTDVDDIISVDSSFAAIEQDEYACDDVTQLAPQEVIPEMNRLIPEVDWKKVIETIQNATGIVRNFAVELHCKQKIRDYAVHLNDLSLRSETNYLGWRLFSKFAEHIVPSTIKKGATVSSSRGRECADIVERFAVSLLAEELGQRWMNSETREKVEKMTRTIMRATENLVNKASWLTTAQKSRLRQQVSSMRIRYPDQAGLGNKKPQFPNLMQNSYTEVIMKLQRQWVIEKLQRLSDDAKISSMDAWAPVLIAKEDSLFNDNKAYIYFDNIREPYLRLHVSNWVNYGALGVIIAREISRVLLLLKADSEHANTWRIWLNNKNNNSCLLMAYASSAGISSKSVSHLEDVLGKELFLDFSAMEIALESAKLEDPEETEILPGLDFTQEKMFFISHAQTRCVTDNSPESPSTRNRLNAELTSLKSFQETFNCPVYSAQCHVWS